MFVIADARHSKVPSYLWKVDNGYALITVDLTQAPQFKTFLEAKNFLGTVKNAHAFEFSIYRLTIKL